MDQQKQKQQNQQQQKFINANDFEEYAKKQLPISHYQYFRSGANQEITLKRNQEQIKNIMLNPKLLQNVAKTSLETQVLGNKLSLPFGISPTAMQKLAHPKGEINCIEAANSLNFIYTLSSLSNTQIEDIQKQNRNSIIWFQLYITTTKLLTQKIIELVEKSGIKALVITIDAPVIGKREGEQRQNFQMPKGLNLEILKSFTEFTKSIPPSELRYIFKDPTITWDDIKEIKKMTKLPVILKGVMDFESAKKGVELGCNIWVSNHGGRQLDSMRSTIEVLQEVKLAINIYKNQDQNVELYVDGGIRSGIDILKCLALGVNYVFIGRPVVYAMTYQGQQGIIKLFNLLQEELKVAMKICGVNDIKSINEDLIIDHTLPKMHIPKKYQKICDNYIQKL